MRGKPTLRAVFPGGDLLKLSSAPLGMSLTLSHSGLDEAAWDSMIRRAEELRVPDAVRAQFTCALLNSTESRMACHPMLRASGAEDYGAGMRKICEEVIEERGRMFALAQKLRSGNLSSRAGKGVRTIVHLGTGGSHWPARLLYEALERGADGPKCLFVASNDPAALEIALKRESQETTAVVVSGKSFRTRETLSNARAAREWLRSGLAGEADGHMFAVTANPEEAVRFGVGEERVLRIPEWMGGRYSIWSAASVSAVAASGSPAFEEFLAGAREVDSHVLREPVESNIPLALALTRAWLHDDMGYPARCMLTYAHQLRSLVDHHQQLLMESCGKRPEGESPKNPPGARCEVVWGGEGPVGEHSFLQFLLQSGAPAPVEIIAFAREAGQQLDESRLDLLSHFVGVRKALGEGVKADKAREILLRKGIDAAVADRLAQRSDAARSQPVTTLLLDEYSPRSVGRLLALYEHSAVAQAAIRGVNAYDQWGVELGKELVEEARLSLSKEVDKGRLPFGKLERQIDKPSG